MDITKITVSEMLDVIARTVSEMEDESYDMEKAKEKISHEQAIGMFGLVSHENFLLTQKNEELEKNLEYFQNKCDLLEEEEIETIIETV
tara:strand:+ start:30 stop:296 length:267 start_codon:yes stop_codon:yes gene_type:complete